MTSASASIGENERLNLCNANALDRPMTPLSTGNVSTVDQINHREKQKNQARISRDTLSSKDGEIPLNMATIPEWAENAIVQEKYINYIFGVINKIEDGIGSLKEIIGQLSNTAYGTPATKRESLRPTNEDIDAIAMSISELDQKVNVVDRLRFELKLLKSRLKRLVNSSRGIILSADSDLWPALPRKRKIQPLDLSATKLFQNISCQNKDTVDEGMCKYFPILGSCLTTLDNDEAIRHPRRSSKPYEDQEREKGSQVTRGDCGSQIRFWISPASSLESRDSLACDSYEPPAKKTKTSRRAHSQGLRNADGVRLTKSGMPDKRAGNYKYLKAYYDKLKGERARETEQERELVKETWQEAEREQRRRSMNKGTGGSSGYAADMQGNRVEGEEGTIHSIENDQDGFAELRRRELEESAQMARERLEASFLMKFPDAGNF